MKALLYSLPRVTLAFVAIGTSACHAATTSGVTDAVTMTRLQCRMDHCGGVESEQPGIFGFVVSPSPLFYSAVRLPF